MTPEVILLRDFPGGSVVKNPPADARDVGSIPGPGGSHVPWSNQAGEPQLPSQRAPEPRSHEHACTLEPCSATSEMLQ